MASIEIIRDIDGIAHVRAASMLDALRGPGPRRRRRTGCGRWSFDRRQALGRLAEIVGPSGVASDAFHRRCGIGAAARADHDALGDETRAVLDAYAAGVNRHLATDADLPPEFGLLGSSRPSRGRRGTRSPCSRCATWPWAPTRPSCGAPAWSRHLGAERSRPAVAVGPELTSRPGRGRRAGRRRRARHAMAGAAQALAIEVGSGDALGVEQPRHRRHPAPRTGRPIVAGDPHRAIDLPNVYWQNHVYLPGLRRHRPVVPRRARASRTSATTPTSPGASPTAWPTTRTSSSSTSGHGREHRGRGVAARGSRRRSATETIAVAGRPTGRDPVRRDRRTARWSPATTGDRTGALRWTATGRARHHLDALVPMLRATSVDDLDRAFVPWVVPVNNVLMADRRGAIAYRMRGRLAVRSRDNGWTAVPGDDAGHDWTGFVADADLPRWRDPACGIPGDRQQPHLGRRARTSRTTGRTRPAPPASPSCSAAGDDWDVESVTALLGDTHSAVAAAFAARLTTCRPSHHPPSAAAGAPAGLGPPHGRRLRRRRASTAPCAASWSRIVSHELGLADDRLPGRRRTVAAPDPALRERPTGVLDRRPRPRQRRRRPRRRCGSRSADLAGYPGHRPHALALGCRAHRRFVHPLAALRPDLADQLPLPPPSSSAATTSACGPRRSAPPSTVACNGPVARYVFDVGDWDRSVWIVPHGVSGDPRSSHHLDQLDDWAALRTRPMRYSAEAVDAATRSIQHVDPSSTPR